MTLEQFKAELLLQTNDEGKRHFLNKYILHGTPFVFRDREDEYFEFRNLVAKKYSLHYQEVLIVGSGKLGFSYHKETEFTYESDIDVAIVSNKLFERFFEIICEYQYMLDKFRKIPTQTELKMYSKFLMYLIKGWMRPDLLPVSFEIDILKDTWFSFFKSLSYGYSPIGNYKVTAGLFKSYSYLERYHLNGINDFYEKIKQ